MPTVDRTARVLLAFTGASPDLGVTEIAAETGLVKSTVHRTLTALVDSGLVAHDRHSARYRLGPRATELGMAALGTGDIRHLALPTLLELRDATGETATASLLVGRQRVYVAQVESHASVRMTVEIGARFPLYAGASGRAILAGFRDSELDDYLAEVSLDRLTERTLVDAGAQRAAVRAARTKGYAFSSAERDPWAASIAAPLHSGGHVIGSISVCGPVARFTPALAKRIGPELRRATAALST